MDAGLVDRVLAVVELIPPGRTASYGTVGMVAGCGPRLVARVLATSGGQACWWRVVRSNGTIAEQLVAEGSRRLAEEGVPTRQGRVDLARYRAELE